MTITKWSSWSKPAAEAKEAQPEKPVDSVPQPSSWAKDQDEEDRVETMIRKSGCWDNHISVVDCMGERKDWRKCQDELSKFKQCMMKDREVRDWVASKNPEQTPQK